MAAARRGGGGSALVPVPHHVRCEDACVTASVLIVDDHPQFRRTARRALERDGWTIAGEAADGEAALLAAQALQPDVVLLDVGLPGMGGLEVAQRMRDEMPELVVVVVSTHDPGDFSELAVA